MSSAAIVQDVAAETPQHAIYPSLKGKRVLVTGGGSGTRPCRSGTVSRGAMPWSTREEAATTVWFGAPS